MSVNGRQLHCMIDLETAGQSGKAAVWSIGIQLFDPWGEAPREPRPPYARIDDPTQFYRNLKITEQVRRGMVIEESTIRWWLGKSTGGPAPNQEARNGILSDPDPIDTDVALLDMERFLLSNKVRHVWAHGVDFDVAIINLLWRSFFGPEKKMPWFFSNTEHTRSVFRLAYMDGKPPSLKMEVAHHAMMDAYRQSCGVQESMRQMRQHGIVWQGLPVAESLVNVE